MFALFALVFLPLQSVAAPACYDIFVLRTSSELPKELVIMSYNPAELVWSEFSHKPDIKGSFSETDRAIHDREISKSIKIKKVVNDIDPDIVMLTEVGDPIALKQFSSRLDSKYLPLHLEGNDPHHMNISFLVKKDLPVEVEYETHRNMKWKDPVDNQVKKLFMRDAPAVIIRKPGVPQPLLIVIGAHSKSMRDRQGDPQSFALRSAEFEGYLSVIHGYQRLYGVQTPIILVGDFNTDVRMSPEIQILKNELLSAFDVAQTTTAIDERITHTFHPHGSDVVRHQIDDILIPDFLKNNILEAQVYRYKDDGGNILPFPSTREQRDTQPSDHFPIFIRFSTQNL